MNVSQSFKGNLDIDCFLTFDIREKGFCSNLQLVP